MRRITIVVRRCQGPMPVFFALLSSVVSGPRGAAQDVPISTLPTVDRILADTPTLIYAVGRAGGEHWEMFYRIGDMSFDHSDNLYVLDGGNKRVVQFDAQGQFVRAFGRDGHGPGEFTGPQHLVVSSVGEVIVDDAQRTFIAFKNGEYVRSVSYRDIAGLSTAIGAGADGSVCWLHEAHPFGDDNGSASVWCHDLDSDGVPTIVTRVSIEPLREITVGDMIVRRRPVYGAAPQFGTLPNGRIVFHYSIDYRLAVLDRHGRVEQEIRRGIDAKTVTSQDRRAWLKEQELRGTLPLVQYEIPFAEKIAVVTGVRTDPSGRIWVQRWVNDAEKRGPIDLMTDGGRYIGTIVMQELPWAVSQSGLAAYVEEDDNGVESVVVRRLPEAWK